jgi:hypothetical protein
MSWIINHARAWRIAALFLMMAAFLGPWVFEHISVPAQFTCNSPFIRLEGDFCGAPLSGMWVLFALGGEIIVTVASLVTGAVSGRMLLIPLYAFTLLLPLISTLLMLFWGNRRRLQIFQIVVLGLAGGLMLWWLVMSAPEPYASRLWGPRLYAGVLLLLLILEGITFASRRRASQASGVQA